MEISLNRLSKTGEFVNEVVFLTQKKSYTFGRKPQNDVVLYAQTISRSHCIFHHNSDGLFVQVLKTLTGLSINGKEQSTGAIVQLNNNDLIAIGRIFKYQVQFKPLVPIVKDGNDDINLKSEIGTKIIEAEHDQLNLEARPQNDPGNFDSTNVVDDDFETEEHKISIESEIEKDFSSCKILPKSEKMTLTIDLELPDDVKEETPTEQVSPNNSQIQKSDHLHLSLEISPQDLDSAMEISIDEEDTKNLLLPYITPEGGILTEKDVNIERPDKKETSKKSSKPGSATEVRKESPKQGSSKKVRKESPKQGSTTEVRKETPKEGSATEVKKESPKEGSISEVRKESPKQDSSTKVRKKSPKQGSTTEVRKESPKDGTTTEVKKESPKQGSTTEVRKESPKQGSSKKVRKESPKQGSTTEVRKETPKEGSATEVRKEIPKTKESVTTNSKANVQKSDESLKNSFVQNNGISLENNTRKNMINLKEAKIVLKRIVINDYQYSSNAVKKIHLDSSAKDNTSTASEDSAENVSNIQEKEKITAGSSLMVSVSPSSDFPMSDEISNTSKPEIPVNYQKQPKTKENRQGIQDKIKIRKRKYRPQINHNLPCILCGKKFPNNNSLNRHMENVHTSVKKYSCEICQKKFKRGDYLKIHVQLHTAERPFPCGMCGKSFIKESDLRRHSETHVLQKLFACEVCDKKFRRQSDVHHHLKIHAGVNRGTCEICKKVLAHKNSLKQHMLTHFGEKTFKCAICFKKFFTKWELVPHFRNHADEKQFTCTICDKKYMHKTALGLHVRKIHTQEKVFKCTTCEKVFVTKGKFEEHIRIHTGEKPYSCEVCDKRFRGHIQLRIHSQTHVPKFSCNECEETFLDKFQLRRHMRTHFPKDNKCPECGLTVDKPSQMKIHRRKHTGENPFVCKICEKRFRYKKSWEQHLMIHDGTQPFPCDKCDKKFQTKNIFRIHYRLHTGEKPFSCVICARDFTHKSSLKGHYRTHGKGPERCRICDLGFREKAALKKHRKKHTKKNAYTCAICEKRFEKQDALVSHCSKTVAAKGKCPTK